MNTSFSRFPFNHLSLSFSKANEQPSVMSTSKSFFSLLLRKFPLVLDDDLIVDLKFCFSCYNKGGLLKVQASLYRVSTPSLINLIVFFLQFYSLCSYLTQNNFILSKISENIWRNNNLSRYFTSVYPCLHLYVCTALWKWVLFDRAKPNLKFSYPLDFWYTFLKGLDLYILWMLNL